MISSKPDDGEPLVERRIDRFGAEVFTATRVLLAFFDDVARLQNTTPEDTSAIIAEIASSAARLRQMGSAESMQSSAEISSLFVQCSQLKRRCETLEARIAQLESLCL